jgi:hypothetical protein
MTTLGRGEKEKGHVYKNMFIFNANLYIKKVLLFYNEHFKENLHGRWLKDLQQKESNKTDPWRNINLTGGL